MFLSPLCMFTSFSSSHYFSLHIQYKPQVSLFYYSTIYDAFRFPYGLGSECYSQIFRFSEKLTFSYFVCLPHYLILCVLDIIS